MKKFIFYLITATIMLATACSDDGEGGEIIVPVTGVTLDQTELILAPGVKKILAPVIAPIDATDKTVTWSSNNGTVVSIDPATGELTSLSVGAAVITVKTNDGGFTATRNVTVKFVPVTGVTIAQTELVLAPGAKSVLTANVQSAAATNKNVIWSSDNESVAIVSATGEVTGRGVGETTVTATTEEGGFTASCTVKVELVNLLVNPGFETTGSVFTALEGWTVIPADWFNSYYGTNAGVMTQYLATAINRIGLVNASGGADVFFTTGNGAFFAGALAGTFACRIEGNRVGGIYQLINVTPGVRYEFSVVVGYRKNNANMSIKTDETVKVLSPNGLTIYHAEPIVTDPSQESNIITVTGEVLIPDGVTQIRFQVDQRTFGNPNQAPLTLFDNCVFTQLAD
ncbi:MAG: Ig-like domain-containing protein [Tannerella sp.]|nr:Ig-like domain-containing protein [Tannerella sp.]